MAQSRMGWLDIANECKSVTVSASPQPLFQFTSLPCFCQSENLNILPPSVCDCKSLGCF